MTDWTALTDAELTSGKPALQTQGRAFRDNPIAIAEGAPGAPKVSYTALSDFAAGSVLLAASNAEVGPFSTSLAKVKEISVPRGGTFTVSFDIAPGGGGNTSGRIYVNGSAVGTLRTLGTDADYTTFTENITVSAGDLIQLYASNNGSLGLARNFRLKAAAGWEFIVNL